MTTLERKKAICRRVAKFEKPKADSKRVAKNTIVLYVRMLAVMAIGLFTGRVTFNALGVTDYGLQSIAGGVIGMITFMMGSLSGASSRFIVVEMGRGSIGTLKRVFSTIFIVHLGLACIFVLLLETIGLAFLETKLNIDPSRIFAVKWTYHCAVFTTFLGITQVPYGAVINAHERMSAFAWMTIYDVVVKLGIAFAIKYYGGDKLILLATLGALSSITTMMIYRIYCIRNFTEARFRRVFDTSLVKPIFSFAGIHILTQTMIMLKSQGVLMINQRYFGPALVAAISVGAVLNTHIQGFIGNFKAAANPQIVKLFSAGKFDESKRMLTETLLFSVFLLLLLGVPAWFYSDEALTIWLGPGRPELSPIIAKIILAGAFFSLFDSSLYTVLYAAGRIKENMYFNVVGGLLTFGLVFYLVRWQHAPLASVGVAAGYFILLGCVFKPILLHRIANYNMRDFRRIFIPSFEALAICTGIGCVVHSLMPAGLFLAIPSCAIIGGLNAFAIYFLVAPDSMQQQFCRAIARVPHIGSVVIALISAVNKILKPIRCLTQGVAGHAQ